jgi:hypothetical protein
MQLQVSAGLGRAVSRAVTLPSCLWCPPAAFLYNVRKLPLGQVQLAGGGSSLHF